MIPKFNNIIISGLTVLKINQAISLNSITFNNEFNSGLKYHQLLDHYPYSYNNEEISQLMLQEIGMDESPHKRSKRDLSDQENLPSCSLNQLLTQGSWKKNRYLSELYTKELEKSGSLWRLDKGMPSLYYDNKFSTCGYKQKPVYGIKYKGNMWCDPHDPMRSCCSNNKCIPSKYCTDQDDSQISEEDILDNQILESIKLKFDQNEQQKIAESNNSDLDLEIQNHLKSDTNPKIYEKQDITNVNFFENKPIDFSDFVWPELSTYEVKNSCSVDLKNSKETCSVLQNNKAGIKNIYFVGDSLTLNYYIGFMSHIMNDYEYGPTDPELWKRNNGPCNGYQEMLYRRTDCKALPRSTQVTNFNCQGTSVNFIDIRNKSDIYKVENEISELKSANKLDESIFVINAGTHEKFRFDMVIDNIMDRVLSTNIPRKNLLWISQVRPSFNVPLKYNRKQSAWHRMKDFYKKIDNWVEKNGVNSLDLHPISANAFSPDGTHYSMGVQLMKTQLLLRYLEELEV